MTIPREKLVVVTGVSGSGKSSLAFDTIYAEGQRRYIESLSAYARQFLPRLPKPDVDAIDGLAPSICVRQQAPNRNPRSTVGTVTEVLDYLRLLYARVGQPHSPATGKPLRAHSAEQMVEAVLAWSEGTRITVLAPVVRAQKGKLAKERAELQKQGFVRIRVDGRVLELAEDPKLQERKAHDLDVVVDRIVIKPGVRERLADSVELALRRSGGRLLVAIEGGEEHSFTERYECPESGYVTPALEPALFSFNSAQGACPACGGLGVEGGPESSANDETDGEDGAERAVPWTERPPCASCGGTRLRPEALLVRLAGLDIATFSREPVHRALPFLDALELGAREAEIAKPVLRELRSRLGFLVDVGLDYISLDRPTATLSGGEAQRVQLATQIGANLAGVLYVLDEPSIGLHARDTERLLGTLRALRDRDNTVLVVEHDAAVIDAADHVIDLGPGAGVHGGTIVAEGDGAALRSSGASVTGAFLSHRRRIERTHRAVTLGSPIRVRGARRNNLKDVDVDIPTAGLVVVTGVSGGGKSSLIMDTVLRAAEAHVRGETVDVLAKVTGFGALERVVCVDAAPIGRSARSCPATYAGFFGSIRELFASVPDARARGYTASRFSFNVKGGRCEGCQGAGVVRVAMHFLPDAEVLCEQCNGLRYNRETLEVRYRGLNIAEVLAMTVDDAEVFYRAVPDVHNALATLRAVGLGYLTLGQSATTLSGGEAQRMKLSLELSRRTSTPTLYVLDEPTTGLHFADVDVLLGVLGRLVEQGHSVVVIEHHLDVVAAADHLIELGPEGGEAGGTVVATGVPAEVAALTSGSPTAPYLRAVLEAGAAH
ncbi:MAG: excinuclease ABC subunit UvrA [Polyangiales bacterium]